MRESHAKCVRLGVSELHRWRTCYLFNNIDGVPVTGIPDGSRTDIMYQMWTIKIIVLYCTSGM